MDVSVREELSGLVEEMTHSGSPSLDESQLKRLKRMCRSSEANVRTTYDLVLLNLSKDHAEVRLSAFQIVTELFPRSHLFRELVISNFQQLAELVTGTESKQPLPPPQPAATRLKEISLLAIRQWNDKFGDGYPKLKLGYNFLKHRKKVDFDRLVAQTEAARRQSAARDARRAAIAQQRLAEVHSEMTDHRYDIDSCLKQMDSCFDLLLPRFDVAEDVCTQPPLSFKPGEFQSRTLSSGSFASLESMDGSESEAEMEREAQLQDNTVTLVDSCCSSQFENGREGGEEGRKGVVGDGEKGKEKEVVMEDVGSSGGVEEEEEKGGVEEGGGVEEEKGCVEKEEKGGVEEEEGGVSSDESDVEWVDVEPIHTASLTQMKENGFISQGLSISIQLPAQICVEETEDNESVLTALVENHHLLQTNYLPMVNRWLQWLTRGGGDADLKAAIDIKSEILAALDKYKKLNIASGEKSMQDQGPKVSLPLPPSPPHSSTTSHPPPITTTTPRPRETSLHVELEQDPTTIQAQLGAIRKKNNIQALPAASTPITQSIHSNVPVVPFDMDLYHWDNPEGKAPPINKVCMSSVHQYWGAEKDIELCDEERALLQCRTIQFAGKFEPVKWSCRAPLPSGKLCPRRDRLKCPFHGPIIPRDEQGQPTGDSTSTAPSNHPPTFTTSNTTSSSSAISETDYNDIEAAVFAAKGIELTHKGKGRKGKRGRQKKYPGLTDLDSHNNTSRKRLECKIFSKRAMRKVADAIDTASAKRFRDKFGGTFNYALEN